MIIVQQNNETYKHEDGEGWDYTDGPLCITNNDGEVIAAYSSWDWVKVAEESKQVNVHIKADIDPEEAAKMAERARIAARAVDGRWAR